METTALENLQKLLNDASTKEERAERHFDLGRHLANSGQFAAAEDHLKISMELSTACGQPLCLRKNWILGECIRNQARFSEAIILLKKGIDAPPPEADPIFIARSLLTVSLALLEMGDHHEALEYVAQSKGLADSLNNIELQAQCNVKLGIILMELKDEVRGIQVFHDALEGFRAIEDKVGMSVSLMNICNGYITTEDYNRAKPILEEAIRINEERGALRHLALNHHSMGSIHQGLKRFDEALTCFHTALNESLKHNDKRLSVYAHISIGEVLTNKAYNKHSEQEALVHLQKALETAQSYNSIADEYKAHKILAQCYEQMQDWERFADHLKKYYELEKESISSEAKNKAGKLEAKLQLERKEKELEIERVRNKEQEAKHAKELADQRLATFTRFALSMAHEVQNPLQFVNNFSEVNIELIEDVRELLKVMILPVEAEELLEDLLANNIRINNHGRRVADVVSKLLKQVNEDKKAA